MLFRGMMKISKKAVPNASVDTSKLEAGNITTKMIYGNTTSLMFAERPKEYHSKPHVHDSEQLNYLLEGEIWIFIEDDVFLMESGDFSRIPEMAVHWSKVKEGPCKMIESHSPPYIGDPELAGENHEKVIGLFSNAEDNEVPEESKNVWAAEWYAENEDALIAEYSKDDR